MLAYHIQPEMVSTWQHWYWYKKFTRSYAVQLETVASEDPFDCWKTTWRSAQRSLGSLHPAARLPLLPSRIACCYVRAEFRPQCFGVVQQVKLPEEPRGYVWYHPHNCCGSQTLAVTMQKYTRCSLQGQKVWRVAVARALSDARHCQNRPRSRHLAVRSNLGQHRLGDKVLSRAPPCPAAAALLQASCKLRGRDHTPARADQQALELRDVGRHDKHCSIYGHDSAACCLAQVCKTDVSGVRCLACLLTEVPWGSWSRNQLLLLVGLLRVASPVSTSSSLPRLPEAFHQLLDAGQSEPAKEPAGVSAPRLTPLLMTLSTGIRLTGHRRLYSALHALQVAAPLHLLHPADLSRVLRALAERPPQRVRRLRPLPERHPFELPVSAACGAATAAFVASYRRPISSASCCPAGGWPALVRAASEGGPLARWPTAALALCLLCELAERLDRKDLTLLDKMVHSYLTCPESGPCLWHARRCGHELWAPILRKIRALTPSHTNVTAETDAPSQYASPLSRPIKGHAETMQHLRAGGSLMRFNDGEQLQLNSEVNGPLARYTDALFRLSFAATAQCPGLCVGLVHPDDLSALKAIGNTHVDWWQASGLPNTRTLFRSGLLPEDQSRLAAMLLFAVGNMWQNS